jgi:hypothetical protein
METNQLTQIEFLRFGSNIPGHYWGCCAADIIQCFKTDPDAKASIQLVDGDGNQPIIGNDGKQLYAGPTNKDIFLSRLRVGTFGNYDMPNHAFFLILTDWQLTSQYGKKWLPIIKEAGFEFVRAVSNSVYAGQSLAGHDPNSKGSSVNYIFMLVRNIGSGNIGDPYTPPKQWTDLPSVVPEAWQDLPCDENGKRTNLAADSHAAQTKCWNNIGPAKFVTEEELRAAGAPVVQSGVRGGRLPSVKAKTTTTTTKTTAFPTKAPEPTVA